jgi:AraC-like DNA-binding protein/mannose-6-phosphate isomerase-like protein (cupin superfamily)
MLIEIETFAHAPSCRLQGHVAIYVLRQNSHVLRHSVTREYDPPKGVTIGSLHYEYPFGFVVPEHAHGADQLLYASSGVMQVSSGPSIWLMPPHFAVWIPAETPHSIRMSSPVSMRTLYLRVGLVKKGANKCRVLHVRPMLRELILDSVRIGQLLTRDRLHAAMRSLIISEIENASVMPTSIAVPEDIRARRIACHILDHPGKQESLEALCHANGASLRTIQRIFRRETGIDFETWRQQARLMRGVELLVSGQSVKEVSGALGFSHIAPFIAMFRKTLGVTPGAWIQSFRTT